MSKEAYLGFCLFWLACLVLDAIHKSYVFIPISAGFGVYNGMKWWNA